MAPTVTMEEVMSSMLRMEKCLEKIEENGRDQPNKVVHKKRSDDQKVYARVRVNIITLGDIDTLREEFNCELALTIKWKEPSIRGLKADEIDWSEHWDPRIYFFNAVSIDKYEVKHRVGLKSPYDDETDPIPDAQLSIRMKGTFKSVMRLTDFPFDYQNLTIKLMSDWPKKVIEFSKDMTQKDSVRTDTFTGGQEWELMKHVDAAPVEEEKMSSGAVNTYPLYNITVNVKRKPSYYMWNVALIMFLITPLAFTSFAVDREAPEDRLSVTLTLLLTAVAFKFVVSQSLPNTSYQTLLDYYVLWCMVFLCLVVVQNAAVSAFAGPSALIFDNVCMIVLGVVTVLVNIVFIALSCVKSMTVGHQMQEATNKYNDLCNEISSRKGKGDRYKQSPTEGARVQEERLPLQGQP
ncbi:cys-loop ligand-gated ion channel-like [Diadema antillarum]|uniref:cys-loop ligand-gated ion channel-like n=1 Tax=Diadema antillarum TaxID=105358 RepID=UPI003A85F971